MSDEALARLLVAQDVAEFLYREAELLDERRFEEWLDLFTEDAHYWMPLRRNVPRDEPEREFSRAGAAPTEVSVKSRFIVYRNRVETETDFLVGKREDLLRRVNGDWKIARRKIVLDQNVLLAKNLTVFF